MPSMRRKRFILRKLKSKFCKLLRKLNSKISSSKHQVMKSMERLSALQWQRLSLNIMRLNRMWVRVPARVTSTTNPQLFTLSKRLKNLETASELIIKITVIFNNQLPLKKP